MRPEVDFTVMLEFEISHLDMVVTYVTLKIRNVCHSRLLTAYIATTGLTVTLIITQTVAITNVTNQVNCRTKKITTRGIKNKIITGTWTDWQKGEFTSLTHFTRVGVTRG